MRNPSYTIVFITPEATDVFLMSHMPKNLTVVRHAALIIPPNDVSSPKDRFGLFNNDLRVISSEEDVVKFTQDQGWA